MERKNERERSAEHPTRHRRDAPEFLQLWNLQIKLVESVKKLFSTDSITKIESAIDYEKFRKEKQTEEDEKTDSLSPFLNDDCMKNN